MLILGLGIVSVWLVVFVFELADRRLPWVLALSLAYGIGAYVVFPRAVRMGLKILQRKRVPSFTITGDGLPGDPVNLALIGTLHQLRTAFATAGWSEADRLGPASSWRMVRAFVLNSPYPTAPFSTLYLFGRGQDIGFQKAIDNSPRKRHHIRFWASSLARAEDALATANFWLNTDRPAEIERVLWVGGATLGAVRLDDFKFQFYQQPYGWPGEKTTTDMPTMVNLRQDPFERTPSIRGESLNHLGGGYMNDFFAREFWRFVLVQQEVAKLAQTAIEYPPMQDPASFNLEAVKKKIEEMLKHHEGQ